MVERTVVVGQRLGPVAWLVAANGRRAGRDTRLGRSTSIGRDGLRNDLVLEDSAVSATHAKIRVEGRQFVLYDLDSRNGTEVNGKRVQKQILMDNDQLRIGRTVLIFKQVK